MKKIIHIFFLFIFLFGFSSNVFSASLSFSPSGGAQEIGKNFSVSFFVNTNGRVINASSGTINFPASLLEVVSISKTGSIFSLWVQEPSYSNASGTINFEGVVLNPGFSGTAGKLLTVTFRPKSTGSATLKFAEGAILANDGLGTNITSSLGTANFTVTGVVEPEPSLEVSAPIISSPTHPDQESWYNKTSATFTWEIPEGALETRLLIGRNPNSTPTVGYVPPIGTRTIDNLGEGTYYFSVQHKTSAGWGPVGRFKLNIDTKPPIDFMITKGEGDIPTLSFEANDLDSGFSYYEIIIGEDNPIRIEEQIVQDYELPIEYIGIQKVRVIAYDKAGNTSESEIEIDFGSPPQTKPIITNYPETIEQGRLLSISGTGTPGNKVVFTLLRRTNVVWTEEAFVEADGTFSFSISSKLALGYHTAVVSSVVDTIRMNSKPVSIKVEPVPLLGFALTFVSYLGIGILVVVGIASFIKIILYFGNDLRRTINFLRQGKDGKIIKHKKTEIISPLKIAKNKKFF